MIPKLLLLLSIVVCEIIFLSVNHCLAADPYSEELDTARQLLDSLKIEEALVHVEKAVSLKPQECRGYVMLSECHYRLSKLDLALADANKAIAINAKSGDAYDKRATVYLAQHKQNEARKDLRIAADLGCASAKTVLELLGPPSSEYEDMRYRATRERDVDKALALFARAVELGPDHPEIYFERASLCVRKKDYDKAISDYSRAISLDPKWSLPLMARGELYLKTGNAKLADKDFDRALALPPEEYDGRLERSQIELRKGKYQDAIRDANVALWTDSGISEAYEVTGAAYAKLGQLEKAADEYTKGIKNSDVYRHSTFLKLRAAVYDRLNRPKDAASDRAQADRLN